MKTGGRVSKSFDIKTSVRQEKNINRKGLIMRRGHQCLAYADHIGMEFIRSVTNSQAI